MEVKKMVKSSQLMILKSSKVWLASRHIMQIVQFQMISMISLISLKYSQFMRYFLKFWLYGEQILLLILTLKKLKHSSMEMTTPLFVLRCLEIGISIRDMDYLTIGMVMDICIEKGNDSVKYDDLVTQEDFDKF